MRRKSTNVSVATEFPEMSEDTNVGTMRRKSTNVSVATEFPEMSEDANLSATYMAGKKGGNFGLPLGAKLFVPEALCTKKDHVTCQVLSPSKRWEENLHLPSHEHITSECFILTSTMTSLKKPVIVQIPFYTIDWEFNELNVRGRWTGENDWVNVGFLNKFNKDDTSIPCIELELTKLGAFIVTFTPKQEIFEVTSNGCLYNARVNRQISVRFPRKGIEQTMQCSLQITQIDPEKIQLCKEQFPLECQDLLHTTEFIDIIPTIPHQSFRRSATIKLPLPTGMECEGDGSNDIAVMHKQDGQWTVVQTKYKFTRSTVSFEVRHLERFCVCQTIPNKQENVLYAIPHLEARIQQQEGDLAVFLSIKEKSWKVLVECFPESKAESVISKRVSSGYIHIKKIDKVPEMETNFRNFTRRMSLPKPALFELHDAQKWTINVLNDIKVSFDSGLNDNSQLEYYRYLPKSYRCFAIEPRENEERTLCGIIEVKSLEADGNKDEGTGLLFEVNINEEDVRAYFKPEETIIEPEPEPEPEPEKPKLNYEVKPTPKPNPVPTEAKKMSYEVMSRLMHCPKRCKPEVKPPPKPNPVPTQAKKMSYEVMSRLMHCPKRCKPEVKPPPKLNPVPKQAKKMSYEVMSLLMHCPKRCKPVERESRVLTGKSLKALSRVVPEGLTLAVHLNLPDSTITGLGFDAISNGMSMAQVTYKILLHWKRIQKQKRDIAVQDLSRALRNMGKDDMADLVVELHHKNKEITPDCFEFVIE